MTRQYTIEVPDCGSVVRPLPYPYALTGFRNLIGTAEAFLAAQVERVTREYKLNCWLVENADQIPPSPDNPLSPGTPWPSVDLMLPEELWTEKYKGMRVRSWDLSWAETELEFWPTLEEKLRDSWDVQNAKAKLEMAKRKGSKPPREVIGMYSRMHDAEVAFDKFSLLGTWLAIEIVTTRIIGTA